MKVDRQKKEVCFSSTSLYVDILNRLNKGKISIYDLKWKDVAATERRLAKNWIEAHGFYVSFLHKGNKIILLFNKPTDKQQTKRIFGG